MMAERDDSGALCAVLLQVRPRVAGLLPAHWGQLIHAGLLDWLREVDPPTAARLHEPNHDRPFTTGALWDPDRPAQAAAQDGGQRLPVSPAQAHWLRITLLDETLFSPFTQPLINPPGGARHPMLRLGAIPFAITDVILTPQAATTPDAAWAGWTTYADLAARATALPAAQLRQLAMGFDSPTCFSDGDRPWGRRTCLLPDPERIFARLAHQWHAFAPPFLAAAADPDAVRAYARERMLIDAYALRTQRVHLKRIALPGFLGWCAYLLPDDGAGDRVRRQIHLLAAFAFYAGIGYKTALGLGRARCIEGRAPRAPEQHCPSALPCDTLASNQVWQRERSG
jgi:CRISPR-associated endoribonuclease Cas6